MRLPPRMMIGRLAAAIMMIRLLLLADQWVDRPDSIVAAVALVTDGLPAVAFRGVPNGFIPTMHTIMKSSKKTSAIMIMQAD